MLVRLCVAVVSLAVVGCGAEAPERDLDLVPVSGTVQLEGKPLTGAIVSFIPTAETPNAEYATGTTDESGKYALAVNEIGEGAVPGSYRVVISKFAMADGSPVPEDQAPADVGATEVVPAKYSSVDNETLRVTIPPEGTSTADFQLQGK